VAPNILLSLALIRLARPRVKVFLQRYGWVAIVLTIGAFLALMPLAGDAVEYGAEGWLWALLGLCQRMYVDGKQQGSESSARVATLALDSDPIYQGNEGLMRLAVCLVAAVVYVWQEQLEFSFPQVQFTAVIVGVAVMSVGMCLFRRGPSLIQPREPLAAVLRFVGRHTLEIYAIQLAGYEVIIMLLPDLAA
jgi:peptidoglycan/LPS O-acetylase OafA/YrhL